MHSHAVETESAPAQTRGVEVRWIGSRPDWLTIEGVGAALQYAGVVHGDGLDTELARRARSFGERLPAVAHVGVDEIRNIRSHRERHADAAVVLDLSGVERPPGRMDARRAARADLILIGSLVALREIRRRYPQLGPRTTLFRPPLDLHAHDAAADAGQAAGEVVFVGPLTASGGLDLLVVALGSLSATLPVPPLVAVCSGPIDRNYLMWCVAQAAESRVVLSFAPADDDIHCRYAGAAVVCAPYREGISTEAAWHAAAARRPFVGSELEPLLEAVDDESTGYLVPPDDVTALGTTLQRLLGNPEARRDLGRRARARVERERAPGEAVARLLHLWREASARHGPVEADA